MNRSRLDPILPLMSETKPDMELADPHAQLRVILQRKQLATLFQPILDMQKGRIYGYEAAYVQKRRAPGPDD